MSGPLTLLRIYGEQHSSSACVTIELKHVSLLPERERRRTRGIRHSPSEARHFRSIKSEPLLTLLLLHRAGEITFSSLKLN